MLFGKFQNFDTESWFMKLQENLHRQQICRCSNDHGIKQSYLLVLLQCLRWWFNLSLVKLACVNLNLISKHVGVDQLIAGWPDMTLLHSTTAFDSLTAARPVELTRCVWNRVLKYSTIRNRNFNQKSIYRCVFWKDYIWITVIWTQIESKLWWTFWLCPFWTDTSLRTFPNVRI